ncbi:MAG TPA: hypothetical protein VFC94_02100 [Bacteroidaceae bacterium]|nr:hypothetical protein [Bacteroidaceae bacterium]
MVYKFIIISDEVDDFFREIQIDSEATFLDFHNAILNSVNYPNDQMTSFFICNENWERNEEITLEEMYTSLEEDSWVMHKTHLDELIEEERQRLIYVFDPLLERCFFIELKEIITGKLLKNFVVTKQQGDAPQQIIQTEETLNIANSTDVDEDFYGDIEFNEDDINKEGFNFSEFDNDSSSSFDTIDDLF